MIGVEATDSETGVMTEGLEGGGGECVGGACWARSFWTVVSRARMRCFSWAFSSRRAISVGVGDAGEEGRGGKGS